MTIKTKSSLAVLAVCAAFSAPPRAFADEMPLGTWLDHTGRGAVKITDCGGSLCGHIVWIKDSHNGSVCGTQVIGNVRPIAGGKWDSGWILDVDDDRKYQVEITPLGNGKLKVMGYTGTKLLSETMIWTRAPADTKTCTS